MRKIEKLLAASFDSEYNDNSRLALSRKVLMFTRRRFRNEKYWSQPSIIRFKDG
jgi:hypothetical protein